MAVAGPWDNVTLPSPPNGPAWAQAAAQLMGATQNSINSGANAFQNWQNFNHQQQIQNFFQDPQNQQLLNSFIQQPTQQNYAALIPAMAKVGGLQAAGPLIDQYLGISQDANIAKAINGGGGQPQQPVSAGPATSTQGAGPENIHGNFSQPRIGYGTGETPNLNTLAANYNLPDPVLQRIATSVGASSPEDDLTPDQARVAQQRIADYVKRTSGGVQGGASPDRGGGNPVAQAGTGNQETPQGLGGSGATSPRPTSGSGGFNPSSGAATPNVQPAPGSFNDRFAPAGVTKAGAEAVRSSPLGDQAKVDAMNARIQQLRALAAASARRSPAAAQQADKRADDIVKERDKLLESISKYNEPGTQPQVKQQLEAGGALGTAIGKRQGEAVEAGGLATRHTIGTIDTMQDALRRSAGKLPEGPFAENTLKFKQAANNYFPGLFDQGAIVDAVAITKLNAQLAAEAAKSMTARPSQLEFRAFMANNPGLTTGVDGALFLSEVIKRTKQQDIKLSSLAAKTSPEQWPSVEEQFFNDPKNRLFTDSERKNPYLVIGQRGPSAPPPGANTPTGPGGWREIAPGIRIREKSNAANQS